MFTSGAFLKDKYKKDCIGKKEVTMFACHICSKEFRRGDNMRRHVKTVHADDETIDERENPESVEDDASDKADDVEPNIQDDSDDDVEEE